MFGMRSLLMAVLALLIAAVPAHAESWVWPVAPPHEVSRPFDKPAQNWLPGHRGVDLATVAGSEVFAAGNGYIAFAGSVGGKPVVTVAHAHGLRTTYEPVEATLAVGARVRAGDPIGILQTGHAGCAVETCLHWGLRRGDEYLDPRWLVMSRNVRLKPL